MADSQKPFLSVVIPAYNEADRLPRTLAAVLAHLREQSWAFEVIVVDDGSTDSTKEAINSFLERGEITYLQQVNNQGKGAAIRAGVLAAQGEFILFTDADLSTPISELRKLLSAIEKGADVAIGSRAMDSSEIGRAQSIFRQFVGKFGNRLIRWILGVPFYDTQCGFKLYRREVAQQLFSTLWLPRWSFDFEIIARAHRAGYKIQEVGVRWEHQAQSKFDPMKDAARCFIDLIWLRWKLADWREAVPFSAIFLFPLVWFGIFRSRYLFNWDAGQFALGTLNFDLTMHQPHPPGYFLFVAFGAMLKFVTQDINLAFELLSLLAILGSIFFFWKITLRLTSQRRASIFATALFATSPLVLFSQNVALTYAFESLAATLLLYLALKAEKEGRSTLIESVVATAFLMGFRPSILLVATPILLWQIIWFKPRWKILAQAIFFGGLTSVIWFIPFAMKVGGFEQVIGATVGQLAFARLRPPRDLNQLKFFLATIVWAMNLSLGLLVLSFFKLRSLFSAKYLIIVVPLITAIPFFLFVHFAEVGYLLAALPSLFLLLLPVVSWLSETRRGAGMLTLLIIYNILMSTTSIMPFSQAKIGYANVATIVEHDQRMASYLEALRQFDPQKTLVVVRRGQYVNEVGEIQSHRFDDVRALAYYAPEYRIIDMAGVLGEYSVAWQGVSGKKESSVVNFPGSIETFVVLTDYLDAPSAPAELMFKDISPSGQHSILFAPLQGIDQFSFLGFTFKRFGTL